MKKILILTFILVMLLSACSDAGNTSDITDGTTENNKPIQDETVSPTQMLYEELMPCDVPPSGEIFVPWESIEGIPQVAYDMRVYESLDELCSDAAYIFTAVIKDVEVEITGQEDWDTPEPVDTTNVWYRLDDINSIKGDIEADGAAVFETGQRYGDINFYHEYFPPMCYGSTYLIFAYDDIRLCSPFVGYTQIDDGSMISSENNKMFEGRNIDDVTEQIQSIEKAINAQEELSADEGLNSLVQMISSEADFAPVRDLTTQEIDLMYRFNNDALAEAYLGKELKNGDIVIWIKTVRLTEQQMDVYEESNGAATEARAEERESYYNVSTTRYHTIITICRQDKDNAVIHNAFGELFNVKD